VFIGLGVLHNQCYIACHPLIASVAILAFALTAAPLTMWAAKKVRELIGSVTDLSPKGVIGWTVGLVNDLAPMVGAAAIATLVVGVAANVTGYAASPFVRDLAIGVLTLLSVSAAKDAIKTIKR
jgi:sugar phosphate permease